MSTGSSLMDITGLPWDGVHPDDVRSRYERRGKRVTKESQLVKNGRHWLGCVCF
jgi:hypothetical protein